MSLAKNARIIINIVKSERFYPNKLSKELRKKSVQAMTFKERCEHINSMCLPYGVVRCTPNLLLRKWLGIDIQQIVSIGNSTILQISQNLINTPEAVNMEPKDFLTKSAFHIAYINGDEIYDYGFFIGVSFDDIEYIVKEGVVDVHEEIQPYAYGLGPQSFQKTSSEGSYNVKFI